MIEKVTHWLFRWVTTWRTGFATAICLVISIAIAFVTQTAKMYPSYLVKKIVYDLGVDSARLSGCDLRTRSVSRSESLIRTESCSE